MPPPRFHDGQHGATHDVRIFAYGRELRIVGENDATLAVWKLDQIQAAPEVDPDGVITLTARGQRGILSIDDASELEMLHRVGVRLPGHKAWTRGHWIAVCAGLVATIGLGVLAVTALPRIVAAAIPVAWERRLGEPAESLMSGSRPLCTSQPGQAALDSLVARLRAAGPIAIPVTLSVIDDPVINAFTLPGGHVLVMRGLIDATDDGPMLAGVIAHELGHVAHRDPTTLMLRGMGLSVLLHMSGFGDAGGMAAASVADLMKLAYTRSAEAAADETAIDLLTKAGLRADGLSRFFALSERRAGNVESDTGPAPGHRHGTSMTWFETHPPSEARRERTARPDIGEMPFTEAEWQAIKAMCGAK